MVKATPPIFQFDFYFAAKVIKSLQPAPPTRRGNQLSLVNETNNDSIIFIYTKLFTESALHTARDVVSLLWFKSHFFSVQTMSQSGHRPGSSNEEDERPILRSFQDGQMDSEDWITGLRDYVTTMREHYPGENHPDEQWLSKGFAMIS